MINDRTINTNSHKGAGASVYCESDGRVDETPEEGGSIGTAGAGV